jgi:hypothetical protein
MNEVIEKDGCKSIKGSRYMKCLNISEAEGVQSIATTKVTDSIKGFNGPLYPPSNDFEQSNSGFRRKSEQKKPKTRLI